MAVEAAASRVPAQRSPLLLQRTATIPAWVWLSGIVVVSVCGRVVAAIGRTVPFYMPDEYIYPSLARSLADHGRPMIRGVGAHFPALLEPLVTAPVWLATKNPETAWRLTQGLHAVVMSFAAIPAYLIARRVGLDKSFALGIGLLAVAVPDTVYASTMLSDPLGYPLALGAVCAGLYVAATPTWRAQLAFVVFSALAVFTRIEYIVLPVAALLGVVAADRGRLMLTVRRIWPSLVALGAPPAFAFGLLGTHRILGPYIHTKHHVAPLPIVHWLGRDAMLLVYSCGWVIVPGALVGLAYALVRPRTRAESSFAVTTLVLAVALLMESAQIANTNSQRFHERYMFILVPLLAVAFGLYAKRGFPRKLVVAAAATGLLVLAARIPLSGYAAGHGKDDSPTLWAVLRLEGLITTGNGSLAIALIGGVLSVVAALAAWRRTGALVVLALAIAACAALSAGAASFDVTVSHSVRQTLPADLRWLDHARLGSVDIVAPPGSRREQSRDVFFWNVQARRLFILDSAPIDQFAYEPLRISPDGRMPSLTRPFAVQTYGSMLQLSGVRLLHRESIWNLYRPVSTPRLQLLVAGRYVDGWLASRGVFVVWTRTGGRLRMTLSVPRTLHTMALKLGSRTMHIHAGHRVSLDFTVPPQRWSLPFSAARPAYAGDRAVSVRATNVRFTPSG